MAIFFRDICEHSGLGIVQGGKEARKERVGKFSKAGRILQANSVNSVWWNFEREHDPSTEKYLANCKNRRRNFYEGCKSWIAGGEGLEKKNCKKRKKDERIGKKLRIRKISINLDKNQLQLRTIERLIKFDLENDLFEEEF